ncbi:MAG: ATP phosphoribosyltransferase regulatory subunit [Lachnospiraceae bacterium]|nr:ATP phosphoribosyltransferase regulatory subunit [Robinsoniella sp.]MDY3767685.1 ATP phosphoribosyltransferase regulatory subunit [Lachnospiraceae bacterium]
MRQQLLHTPEGVRDRYREECEKKLTLQDNLHCVLRRYGYRDIETPTFEYFDVFGREIGTTPSKDLYKFFDREGNTLVLRPDITPSVSRAFAKYFAEEELAVRLCYVGNTFINNSSYQGRLKETTQLGAELIGDDSVDADAEIVAMVVETLLAAGLKEFQISVGHAEFFKSLLDETELLDEEKEELHALIANKNYFGAEELLSTLKVREQLKEALISLPQLFGTVNVLDRAEALAGSNEKALSCVRRLRRLYQILRSYGCEAYISFDLGMMNSYGYYTGVIFRGYTFGTGDEIVKGGRYDQLLQHFGKEAPSIGFVVVIDQLLTALSRQKIDVELKQENTMILYRPSVREQAIALAKYYRELEKNVELTLQKDGKSEEEYIEAAKKNQIRRVVLVEEDGKAVMEDLVSGMKKMGTLEALMEEER